ncbi:hypothetical protein [Paenibacillus sp. AR247]|nr:hypothetical protein [Paenibacillus sp. AR247]
MIQVIQAFVVGGVQTQSFRNELMEHHGTGAVLAQLVHHFLL